MGEGVARQEVIELATRLFGELGYDGVSIQLIADAMGVGPSAITEATGTKRDLYLEVTRQVFESESRAFQEAVVRADPGRPAIHQIVDAYLDFHLAHREVRALWAHRWMADAADISELEDHYVRPLLHLATRKIRDVVPPDVNPYYLFGTMIWCVHGYLGSGVFRPATGLYSPATQAIVADFRAHLHVLMDRLLVPQDRLPDWNTG
ncbi:hypothetical protein BJF79_36160 [Actinomadura sp. CNU-125]|uniref:TetR/AcrR family transcriptional regulator n=1 Tax=Actinomadura sp. CNU-125 TaxID=1904961 RepID=UPI0009638B58|nr:TetR/AcrR family transcriptional regulator [Actinomadura sp. CNU-125]OLT32419.1 hypothetical protein BJF79_36160 [Actinomadura sp. CNU-125]